MSAPALRISKLTKSYASAIALTDLSLEVAAGDFFGLVGENGTYTYAATASATTSPTNPYGVYMQVIYDGVYGTNNTGADGSTASPQRHNIKTGAQVPVEIIVEVDRKIDDGAPNTGGFQFSVYQGNGAAAPTDDGAAAPSCTSAAGAAGVWNATNGSTNCGGASLL